MSAPLLRIIQLIALGLAAVLTACSSEARPFTPVPSAVEDCAVVGDEDGNGAADCADPACAGATACQVGCGNGKLEAGEGCDDGNGLDGDGCDTNCTVTGCGNGVQSGTEACDDGNPASGDGCDANCRPTGCGNGVVTAGEVCDDDNLVSGDGCDANCRPTGCGNGIPTSGELCDDGNDLDGDGCDSNCTVTACGNGIPTSGELCDDGNDLDGDGCESDCAPTPISATSYLKASNTGASDYFGHSIALSADGSTLAVAAVIEDSAATGIGGNQSDNSVLDSGAVYVFVRSGATWVQQAYIKASNTGGSDQFGHRVALSGDGSTLAVGARLEASAATGIDGNQADNSASTAGAVYVYARSGTTWSQQAYIKASNTGRRDFFSQGVALSGDGATLAVGAYGESSAATGINGNQADNSASQSGAVYVYTRSGTVWSQQAYVKASNTDTGDFFGHSVALSGDGSTLAVSAYTEDSAAMGIDGNQLDNSASGAGAVYMFTRNGTTWAQQAYVKASNTGAGDLFGYSVALSGDGATLAVGAYGERSAATGINGDQSDDSAANAGAAYVYTRSGTTWAQQAYVKASNTNAGDLFGYSIALSNNGSILALGAYGERSTAIGIDGNQADNSSSQAGAAYVLTRSGTTWSQRSYFKATNTGANDLFGFAVSLSADGLLLAVSAVFEDSAATGVGGDQSSNAALESGAVYTYR
jgi:cysteine-rich repeat protein